LDPTYPLFGKRRMRRGERRQQVGDKEGLISVYI
jgi:hypothetical protein